MSALLRMLRAITLMLLAWLALGTVTNVSAQSSPPEIDNVSESSAMPGDSLTLLGQHFGSAQGSSTVYVGGTLATIQAWSDSSILISLPAGTPTGSQPIYVTVLSVSSNSFYLAVGASAVPDGCLNNSVGANRISAYFFCVPAASSTTGYAPNGDLLSYNDSVNGNWQFTYDSLNRLQTASAQSGPYATLGLTMTYDSFGNRTGQTSNLATVPTVSTPNFNAANQLVCQSGACPNLGAGAGPFTPIYDNAGNMTSNGSVSLAYDADGNVCASQALNGGLVSLYLYDAEGHRVAKGHSASNSANLACTDGGSDFVPDATYTLGLGGEQVAEYRVDATNRLRPHHSNVYAAGELIATFDLTTTTPTLHYHISDALGTRRVQVSANGVVELNCTNLPYGDPGTANQDPCTQMAAGAQDLTEQHFTGKERDLESGLDYFGARYYASAMGRFTSPDWSALPTPIPYVNLANPQSLNLYTYGGNNPITQLDADGHCDGFGVGMTTQVGGCSDATNGDGVPVGGGFHLCTGAEEGAGTCNGGDVSVVQPGAPAQQQSVQDPTLPTAVAPPTDIRMEFAKGKFIVDMALTIGTDGLGELPELARGIELTSSIGEDTKLVKYAEEAGKSVQKGLDSLTKELSRGNTNPGLGTKSLGKGISYARARDGARVFFQQAGSKIEILAKASKANESSVINYLKSLF